MNLYMRDELVRKIRSGELSFSEEEISKFGEMEKLAQGVKVQDSSERVVGSLKRSGFEIRGVESFYHDNCYFILAERV